MAGRQAGRLFWGRLRPLLALGFALWWTALAVRPSYRADWLLENVLVFVGVPLFLWLERRVRFSALSWVAVFLFLSVHVYGAHYTYSESPFGFWLREALGTVRNPYDRLAHFLFGLLLGVPMREALAATMQASRRLVSLTAIAWIAALSTVYELLEWGAMLVVAPELGIAFMGTQGDVFDAHKDSALAVAGAIVAVALAHRLARQERAGV